MITKVGASYVDDMNDDVPEVNSFSRECYSWFTYLCNKYSTVLQPQLRNII